MSNASRSDLVSTLKPLEIHVKPSNILDHQYKRSAGHPWMKILVCKSIDVFLLDEDVFERPILKLIEMYFQIVGALLLHEAS